MYGLYARIRKRNGLLDGTNPRGRLPKTLDWRRANLGQKHDPLRDDAAAGAARAGINGSRGGLRLGGVRGGGEERSEEIHCCVGVCELRDAMNLSEAERLIHVLLLYPVMPS